MDRMDIDRISQMPDAEVICRDGRVGQLEALGVRPRTDEVTHLVVRRGFMFHRDVLVPVDRVAQVEEGQIALDADLRDVVRFEPYVHRPSGLVPALVSIATLPLRIAYDNVVRPKLDEMREETAERFRELQQHHSQRLRERGGLVAERAADALSQVAGTAADALGAEPAPAAPEIHRTDLFDRSAVVVPVQELDLNTASEEVLISIRGIGPSLARQIIAMRPFTSVDELHRIPELSAHTLERLKQVFRV